MTAAIPSPRLDGLEMDRADEGCDDAELVQRVVDGDTRAFDALVRAYGPRVFRFLLRFVRQREDAEDLTQQTFLRAYRSIASFDSRRPMINWLLTIARRCALNHFRAAKPTESLSEREDEFADARSQAPDSAAEAREARSNLWADAKRRLSHREHEALWLRFGEDLSVKETARIMGITQPHVKILVFRAKRELMKGAQRA